MNIEVIIVIAIVVGIAWTGRLLCVEEREVSIKNGE